MDDHRSARSMVGDLDLPGFAVTPGRRSVGAVIPVVRADARRLADDLEVSLTYLPVQERGHDASGGDAVAMAGELSRLRHDHLIRIHDVLPLAGGGETPSRLVLATAVAGAGSLTELLTRRSPLSLAETTTIVIPLVDALTYLHRNNVVHGALTTDAVLFTDRGMPLLADTAIDRLSCVAIAAMAASGTSAPEIYEGYEATTESDAYAFAAMIWTALVGSGPGWVGDRGDLAELAPHVPERVISVVTSALSPDPGERPDLSEIACHLRASVVAGPIDLAELDAGRDVPRRIRALAARQPTSHRAPRRRRAPRLAVVAVAALAVALAVVTLLLPGPLNLIQQDALASTTKVADAAAPPLSTSVATTDREVPPSEAAPEGESPTSSPTKPTGPGELAKTEADEKVIIQELLDARAAAWESGDSELLVKAHSLGSAAMKADRDDLDAARSQGSRLKDVTFVLAEVEKVQQVPRAATSLAEVDELSAQISVRRESLTMVAPGGSQETVPPRTDLVDVTLRREPYGWRFVSWN